MRRLSKGIMIRLNEVKSSTAQIIIGKTGLSESVLDTIKKKLNKYKIIKIKILKTAAGLQENGRKKYAELIASKLDANLIEIRGYNLIIQKRRR